MDKDYYVYILANRRNGTLYVGVTSHLVRRVWEHKNGFVDGFSKEHGLHQLMWFESGGSVEGAIALEKQIKKWNRVWKIRLIEEMNPYWNDLYPTIVE